MRTYKITYQVIAPAFKNSELEITPQEADAIRAELATQLKTRLPLVYGRDWDYEPVKVRETTTIEADSYSIVTGGDTAHFYRVETGYEGVSVRTTGKVPIASILHVIDVREIDNDRD